MNPSFFEQLDRSTAHRQSRDDLKELVLQNPDLFKELLQLALKTSYKNHFKACWVLELVVEANNTFMKDYQDLFCENLQNFTNESALRSVAKIGRFMVENSKTIWLNIPNEQKLIDACFDWLISGKKVATKAYAMQTLGILSKKQPWIIEELKPIIEKDYATESPAFKACARMVLKKIQKNKK